MVREKYNEITSCQTRVRVQSNCWIAALLVHRQVSTIRICTDIEQLCTAIPQLLYKMYSALWQCIIEKFVCGTIMSVRPSREANNVSCLRVDALKRWTAYLWACVRTARLRDITRANSVSVRPSCAECSVRCVSRHCKPTHIFSTSSASVPLVNSFWDRRCCAETPPLLCIP
jgi:hypothetical protein